MYSLTVLRLLPIGSTVFLQIGSTVFLQSCLQTVESDCFTPGYIRGACARSPRHFAIDDPVQLGAVAASWGVLGSIPVWSALRSAYTGC